MKQVVAFLKKSPAKNFCSLGALATAVPTPMTPGQKFFGSFLQKRTAFL
jgi:hypothetical protein